MEFVLSESCSVSEGLSDIFHFEFGEIIDDLGRSHAIGHQVDDVGYGDSKAPESRSPGENLWVVCYSVESLVRCPLERSVSEGVEA